MDAAMLNPFGFDPADDLPFTPLSGENWTEHYFFFGYDREQRHGICVHLGRLIADPTIWRSVVEVFLPEGELLVSKTHGRSVNPQTPAAGPVALTCEEPLRRWLVTFDGAAHRTTRQSLATGLFTDGPEEPFACSLRFEAAAPVFGKLHDSVEGNSAGSFHIEQIMSMAGTVTIGGRTIALKGMGVRDHSSGKRDYGPVLGTLWFHALFPSGKAIQTQVVHFEQATLQAAYIFRGDGSALEKVEILEHPPVAAIDSLLCSIPSDPMDDDRAFRIVLKTSAGIETVEGEILDAHFVTLAAPVEEWIGTASADRPGLQMTECPAVVRCAGEIGTALKERVARLNTLKRD